MHATHSFYWLWSLDVRTHQPTYLLLVRAANEDWVGGKVAVIWTVEYYCASMTACYVKWAIGLSFSPDLRFAIDLLCL